MTEVEDMFVFRVVTLKQEEAIRQRSDQEAVGMSEGSGSEPGRSRQYSGDRNRNGAAE